jgi:hypothetical protein
MMALSSGRADDATLQRIELAASTRRVLDEFEPGDLALGLSVRPSSRDRGANGRLGSGNAVVERSDQALFPEPRITAR